MGVEDISVLEKHNSHYSPKAEYFELKKRAEQLGVKVEFLEIQPEQLEQLKDLMEHRNWIYLEMADNHTLTAHLTEIDKEADSLMEILTEEMMKKEGVNEKLKADDQMEWVRRANSILSRAEEIVLTKLIYA